MVRCYDHLTDGEDWVTASSEWWANRVSDALQRIGIQTRVYPSAARLTECNCRPDGNGRCSIHDPEDDERTHVGPWT